MRPNKKTDNLPIDTTQVNDTAEIIFAQAIMNGETQADAFTKAFPEKAAKYGKNTLTTEAHTFLHTKKIKNLLTEMKRELQKEATMHFLDKIELLQDWMNDPNINVKDRLKAIDIHNKMTGDLAQMNVKVENTGKTEMVHTVDSVVIDALDKLLANG